MAKDAELQETKRDIRAARAEIGGRRDQLTADYDERLGALDDLLNALDEGEVEPRAASAQVRRLLAGDRSPKTSLPRQAGRTTIGMPVSGAQHAQKSPPAAAPKGPTPARAQMAVGRQIASIDRRVMQLLDLARGKHAHREARLELSALVELRRALQAHLDDLPNDVILLTSVVEYTEHTQAVLDDLEAGGRQRLDRLLEHDRTLTAELAALGAGTPTVTQLKERIKQARAALGEGGEPALEPALQNALHHALDAFATLQSELQRRAPLGDPSLLDQLLISV